MHSWPSCLACLLKGNVTQQVTCLVTIPKIQNKTYHLILGKFCVLMLPAFCLHTYECESLLYAFETEISPIFLISDILSLTLNICLEIINSNWKAVLCQN